MNIKTRGLVKHRRQVCLDVYVELGVGELGEHLLQPRQPPLLHHSGCITEALAGAEVHGDGVAHARELRVREVADVRVPARGAEQVLVVRHHHLLVPGQVHVQLQHPRPALGHCASEQKIF